MIYSKHIEAIKSYNQLTFKQTFNTPIIHYNIKIHV